MPGGGKAPPSCAPSGIEHARRAKGCRSRRRPTRRPRPVRLDAARAGSPSRRRSGSGTSMMPSRQSTASYDSSGSSILLEVRDRLVVALRQAARLGSLRRAIAVISGRRPRGRPRHPGRPARPHSSPSATGPAGRARAPGPRGSSAATSSIVAGQAPSLGGRRSPRSHPSPAPPRSTSRASRLAHLVQVDCRRLLCLLSALHDQISLSGREQLEYSIGCNEFSARLANYGKGCSDLRRRSAATTPRAAGSRRRRPATRSSTPPSGSSSGTATSPPRCRRRSRRRPASR